MPSTGLLPCYIQRSIPIHSWWIPWNPVLITPVRVGTTMEVSLCTHRKRRLGVSNSSPRYNSQSLGYIPTWRLSFSSFFKITASCGFNFGIYPKKIVKTSSEPGLFSVRIDVSRRDDLVEVHGLLEFWTIRRWHHVISDSTRLPPSSIRGY